MTYDDLKREHPDIVQEIDALAALGYPAASTASAIRLAAQHGVPASVSLYGLADLYRRTLERQQRAG